MKYELIMENWRQFMTEADSDPDDILKVLFSAELNSLFKEGLNEVESLETKMKSYSKRAQFYAKKYGIPLALATSVLAGGAVGPRIADVDASPSKITWGMQAQKEDPSLAAAMQRLAATGHTGYQDLSNEEAMEKAWEAYSDTDWEYTPKSIGGYPVTTGKGRHTKVQNVKFVYVPADKIEDQDVLPLSLQTAAEYRQQLQGDLEDHPAQSMLRLKDTVFGSLGQWQTGTAEEGPVKFHEGHPILPPAWSIAYDVYTSTLEGRIIDLIVVMDSDNPTAIEMVVSSLGADSPEEASNLLDRELQKVRQQ